MIVIFAEPNDPTVKVVIDWIIALGKGVFLFNPKKKYLVSNLLINNDYGCNFDLTEDGNADNSISYSEIGAVWIWRGVLKLANLEIHPLHNAESRQNTNNRLLNRFLKNEKATLKEFIYYQLSTKPSLTTHFTADVNKLKILYDANTLGLNIPSSGVVFTINELVSFKQRFKKIITKSMASMFYLTIGNEIHFSYTDFVQDEDIEFMNEKFSASFVQEYIEKAVELRIVFLDNEFFPMAIYSQDDELTRTDFRRYNAVNPNKTEPCSIPKDIESKLLGLMRKSELNFGSIDMILTPDDRYIFLEVNPVGQIGMVSAPCNYRLEQKIAIYLNKIYEQKETFLFQ